MRVIRAALPRVARPLPKPNLGPGMKKPGMANHLLRVAKPLPPPPPSGPIFIGKTVGNPKLSILICTLANRQEMLSLLLEILIPQMTGETEILMCEDNGEISVGLKRQKLIQEASGYYVCFVDDDDMVTKDYIPKILTALQTNPDTCGVEGIMTTDGKDPKKFIHSMRYDHWYEENNIYYRGPHHINPTRKDLVLKTGYNDLRFAEDHDFAKRIYDLLNSEVYIDGPIIEYRYRTKK